MPHGPYATGGGVVRGPVHDGGMASTRRSVPRPQLPQLSLPDLTPYAGPGLEPDGDHDTESLTGLDLSRADGGGSTFLDCALRQCDLTGTRLKRARLIDTVLEGVTGVGTDLADAELRDVELTGARLGGAQLHGARLTRVHVRGGKLDVLNLRQATLVDVTFEGCVLVEPDFGGARLERVSFRDCALRGADLSAAGCATWTCGTPPNSASRAASTGSPAP